jgi:hypothetical protein
MRKTSAILFLLFLSACSTRFTGSAKFPDGPMGCYRRCTATKAFEMDSYVYMGDYSTACVCRVKGNLGESRASVAALGVAAGVGQERSAGNPATYPAGYAPGVTKTPMRATPPSSPSPPSPVP